MQSLLTGEQNDRWQEFKEFVAREVEPKAGDWDRAQRIPDAIISVLGKAGYLGSSIPKKHGGQGWDTVTFGLLNEAMGRGSSALTDLLTGQAMVSMTVLKWATEEQKSRWLPMLASGEMVGAFALTEPGGGSDLQSLTTEFKSNDGGSRFVLRGRKAWISYGQAAGVFLVFGRLEGKPMACLVPRESAGVKIKPIDNV